ncbi:Uncharacterised protein [Enterococcus gallinarum]|nr:Uncharacterised protein [Enterococcus gallinarum]
MAKKQNYIWRTDRNFALDEYEKQQYSITMSLSLMT